MFFEPDGVDDATLEELRTWRLRYDNEDRVRVLEAPPPTPGAAPRLTEFQYDEVGSYCGALPTLGMDVVPAFKVSKARLQEVSDFAGELQKRLQCIASTKSRNDCPSGLATGSGNVGRIVLVRVRRVSPPRVFDDRHGRASGRGPGLLLQGQQEGPRVGDHLVAHTEGARGLRDGARGQRGMKIPQAGDRIAEPLLGRTIAILAGLVVVEDAFGLPQGGEDLVGR